MGSSRSRSADGFTLIELLVVISIILVLAALVVPAVGPMLRGSQLTQAEQILEAQLSLARQIALTKNRSVEVRFYQYASPDVPGEIAANPVSGKFRAVQCFELSDSGTATATDKIQYLPNQIIIDSGSTLCSLVGSALIEPAIPTKKTGAALAVPIPSSATQYNCVYFRFLPDGSTNLPSPGPWFLTLHALVNGDGLQTPPANFRTLQIDAINGHVRTYRP